MDRFLYRLINFHVLFSVDDSLEKMLVCPMEDLDDELPRDEDADEETAGEGPSVGPRSAEEESAVSHGAASPAVRTPATDGSPGEVKKSWLKRVRKFFGRVTRTLFGKKK